MRMRKWFTALLLAFALLLGGCVPAYAAQQALGQLQLSLTTDKAAYGEFEQITATLEIANNSKTDMYDIDVAHQLLNGYKLAPDAKDTLRIAKLGAGETQRSVLTYVHELGEYVDPNGVVNVLPATGDDSAAAVWGVLLLGSLALIVVLGLRYRSVQRVLSLVLCVGCLLSCVTFAPVQAKAEDQDEESGVTLSSDSIALTERVAVGKGHVDVGASVKFSETSLRDSDGDGLQDYIENIVGSSNAKADTDGDGLTDVQEVTELGTDPTKADSDGDGIVDAQEDTDGDGLENGYEYANGLKPILKDTDFDGLTDAEELNAYGTDPRRADTDGDGANDGLEAAYGTDPRRANASFAQTVASEPVSENNPVAVEVRANVPGSLLGTVTVTKADYASHPFATGNIPGTLGSAYAFTAGGAINSAQVTFRYDTSLGTIGDKFKPRIYYVNEETQELEELPDQTVKNGEVSVSIDHFSCYILLNKVEFDAIWETEIKPPEYTTDKTGIDVVFVIDSSGSMGSNDGNGLRRTAAKNFVAKLGENDRGAVVDFDSTAHIYQGFTSEHVLLNSAIDRIGSSGGTNLSNGMKAGIGLFTDTAYTRGDAYKYIIFLTDGDGSYSEAYTAQAAQNDIVVYTIGLGSGVKENTLRKIAEGTNGKYFFASAAGDLPSIYEDVSQETVGFTKDRNNDGISDYYTQLIYEGKLVLKNGSYQFIGDDFNYDVNGNLCDDYDGDGLKNGEELIITETANGVSMKMISNPLLPDSDYDGFGDKEELDQRSDPLKYSYNHHAVDFIREDENFWGYELANDYDTKTKVKVAVDVVDLLTFNWDPVKDCKQMYMDYFYDYGLSAVKSAAQANEMETAIEWTANLTQNTKNGIKYIMAGKNFVLDNSMKILNDLHDLRKELHEVARQLSQAAADPNRYYEMRDLFVKLVKIEEKLDDYGFMYTKLSVKVSDFANKYQNLMNKKNFTGLKNSTSITIASSVLVTGLDVASTINDYSKLRANEDAFAENLDILAYLAVNGKRERARDAANQLYELMESEFLDFDKQRAKAVATDVAVGGAKLAVSLLVSTNPYAKAVKMVIDLADLLLGLSHKAETVDNALALESLTTALRTLCVTQLTSKEATYDCVSSHHEVSDRYLMHLAQVRIVGEKNYVDYMKNTGLVTMWFTEGYEAAKRACERTVRLLNVYAKDMLYLPIADDLTSL